MLADDTAASAVVFGAAGLIGGLPKGAIHLSMSTLSVALSERMAQAHTKAGQRYVAAPVFGRPEWQRRPSCSSSPRRCRRDRGL